MLLNTFDNLEQIEADVVIVFWNENNQTGKVESYWECETKPKELIMGAVQSAMEYNEHCGRGEVEFQIYDFRKSDETTEE